MSARRWAARLLRGLVILLLLVDSFGKLAEVVPVVEGTARLGYPIRFVLVIGLLELLCTIAYAVPRTAAVGAVLLTGYLGGAVASHLRIEDPVFTHVLSPVYMAMMIWTGVLLSDDRLRRVFLLRSEPAV
jgi:hypothetical protein